MWLLLRIRATFSEIVSTNAASGVGVETSAQRIAELAARSLRNIARTEKNRTALYKAGPHRCCSPRHSLPFITGQDSRIKIALDDLASNICQALLQGKIQACQDLWIRRELPHGVWAGRRRSGRNELIMRMLDTSSGAFVALVARALDSITI